MKKIWMVPAIIVAVVIAAVMMKDAIIKNIITSSVSKATSLRLEIGSFKIDLGRSIIDIRDMKLANPPAFDKTYMIDAPEIYIAYDLSAIMKGKTHLKELRLNLKEFVLMRAASGKTNIDTLRSRMAAQSGKRADPAKSGLLIDDLRLRIGRVGYRDLGAPSLSRDINLDINERFSGITDMQQVVGIIMTRAVINSGIARLANLDTSELKNIASTAMQGAFEKAIGTSGFGSSDTAKQAAGAVKEMMNIFGSGDKK
jgi:uncharacterized protein involved in outer membrane biogenesis